MKKKILIALLSIALVFTMMPLAQGVSYAAVGDDITVTGAKKPVAGELPSVSGIKLSAASAADYTLDSVCWVDSYSHSPLDTSEPFVTGKEYWLKLVIESASVVPGPSDEGPNIEVAGEMFDIDFEGITDFMKSDDGKTLTYWVNMGEAIPEDFALYVKGEDGKTTFRTEDPAETYTVDCYNKTGTVTYEWYDYDPDSDTSKKLLRNTTGKFTLNKLGFNYGRHDILVYAQDEEYNNAVTILTFKIDYDLNNANITVKNPVYNGKTGRVPTVIIKAKLNGKQKTLKKGTDFTLKFKQSALKRKAVGIYSYMIEGKNYFYYSYDDETDGEFDYYDRAFKILPKGTYIRSIKAGYKKLSVKWKKQSGKMPGTHIWGYQVQVATNKAFTKNKKTKTIKGYKKTSKTIRSLKSGKKYYVRVRTCKKVSGSMYYSKWSAVQTKRTR